MRLYTFLISFLVIASCWGQQSEVRERATFQTIPARGLKIIPIDYPSMIRELELNKLKEAGENLERVTELQEEEKANNDGQEQRTTGNQETAQTPSIDPDQKLFPCIEGGVDPSQLEETCGSLPTKAMMDNPDAVGIDKCSFQSITNKVCLCFCLDKTLPQDPKKHPMHQLAIERIGNDLFSEFAKLQENIRYHHHTSGVQLETTYSEGDHDLQPGKDNNPPYCPIKLDQCPAENLKGKEEILRQLNETFKLGLNIAPNSSAEEILKLFAADPANNIQALDLGKMIAEKVNKEHLDNILEDQNLGSVIYSNGTRRVRCQIEKYDNRIYDLLREDIFESTEVKLFDQFLGLIGNLAEGPKNEFFDGLASAHTRGQTPIQFIIGHISANSTGPNPVFKRKIKDFDPEMQRLLKQFNVIPENIDNDATLNQEQFSAMLNLTFSRTIEVMMRNPLLSNILSRSDVNSVEFFKQLLAERSANQSKESGRLSVGNFYKNF